MKQIPNNLYTIERNREVVFLESIRELKRRRGTTHPYNLVRMAAILRFLVIDKSKYCDIINRKYKLKFGTHIKCGWLDIRSLSSEEPAHAAFLVFKYEPNVEGEFIKLPNFLKMQALKLKNGNLSEYLKLNHIEESYSVQEIIKLIANGHGGVHIEEWKDISIDLMTDETSPFNINTNSKLHDLISEISSVIIESLNDLVNVVHENLLKTQPVAWEVKSTFVKPQHNC